MTDENAASRHNTLTHMVDGLITLDEGRERYLHHGGSLDDFNAFAKQHRNEIFHGDPTTSQVWPWPDELA